MNCMLNTLFVTTQGAYLAKDHETLSVRHEDKELLTVPLHHLSGIVGFGQVSVSPFLMSACCERGIGVSFLTENGRFLGRVEGAVSGNVLLRRQQYRYADDPGRAAAIARCCIIGKVVNARQLLLRSARENPGEEAGARLREAADTLGHILTDLDRLTLDMDTLRGREGEAAATYFSVFGLMVRSEHPAFAFPKRSRRPPADAVNALLSFFYTLLMHDCTSALQAVGLDPAVGFLHADRPGRLSLALDLMEEFRPALADRLALALINRGQVKPEGFQMDEAGGCRMDEETRKTVLTAWQMRKRDEVTHPFTGDTIPIGLALHLQSRLLARHIRGDLDAYPPFTVR